MAKIFIKAHVREDDDKIGHKLETQGILNNNKIIYWDNDISVTISIFDNKIEMTRKNNNYTLFLTFMNNIKTNGYYYLSSMQSNLPLTVMTTKFVVKPGNIEINYQLSDSYTPKKTYFFSLEYAIVK